VIYDTNAVSDFLDGIPAVTDKVATSEFHGLPVIVMGEYLYGLESSREKSVRKPRFVAFTRTCRLLSVTPDTAARYADIRHRLRTAGTPIPENDIWIAALALEHGQQVLSNDRHFDLVEDPVRISW
jgi:predicted nucleic acid-binding protein